jgi:hypothetical protein
VASFEKVRAPWCQACEIPGAGHGAHVEYPRAMLGFIEAILDAD